MTVDFRPLSYAPEPPPTPVTAEYLARELERIGDAFRLVTQGYNITLYVEPERKEEGMIVIADGTTWNPGSGRGAYEYKSSAWVKL